MVKKRNNKILYFVLVLMFVLFGLFFREQVVYENSLVEDVYEIIPSSVDKGFTMQTAERNLEFMDTAAKVVSLKPGDTYEGHMIVKNYGHADESKFLFKQFDGFVDPELSKKISLEFESEDFILKSREWRLLPYVLTVSEDLEEGDYTGVVTVREDVLYNGADPNMHIAVAVGVEFQINVSNEPKNYVYEDKIDKSVELHDIAMRYVIKDIKLILGFVSIVLCFVFLYLGLASGSKKKNNKRKKTRK